jgi:biotin carboxylase
VFEALPEVSKMMSHSILYVIPSVGGPPPEFALPRLRRHGNVHALLVAPPSPSLAPLLDEWCSSVRYGSLDAMLECIVEAARDVCADAIVAFSEFAIVAVAAASEALGLRGPGANVIRSRDKVQMRATWKEHGLSGPAYVAVRSLDDLQRAARELPRPFLLKPTWLAGSQGQVIVDRETDLLAAWRIAATAVEDMERVNLCDFMPIGRGLQFIAEEIIQSSTESWYDIDGYADYVSVEGVVRNGRYQPVCITARLPTIPPFVETSFHVPTVLSVEKQRAIEAEVRRAVDALGLEDCGTHTELKLQRDGQLCLLENAARLGGAMIPRLVHEAFGVDLLDLVVCTLLDKCAELPESMLTDNASSGAVASLMLLATDSRGTPWSSLPAFRPDDLDWRTLTSTGTQVDLVRTQSRPNGASMPAFSPTAGARNCAGTLLLRAADPHTLRDDCYRIMDGLESALSELARIDALAVSS